MTTTKTINFTTRLEAQEKKDAEKLFEDLGMTLSSAIHIFIRQALMQQGLPFPVVKPQPNQETLAAMKEAFEMEKTGSGKAYRSIDELRKDLLG